MRISIVIPSYNHCEDLLKPCIDSIIKYTDLDDIEVIVSANGCIDFTKEYVECLQEIYDNFKLVWSAEPTGYIKSTNAGIKVATGEYILLLNNDIELLPQVKNTWINQLLMPFIKDPMVGGTGPFVVGYPRFIAFFCAMIKRDMFDKFGLLDEIFHPGTCEDVDFCAKMTRGGYKIVQIPNETDKYYQQEKMLGGCPIYHKGSKTFCNVDPVLLARNKQIIAERYGLVNVKLNLGCGDKLEPGYINIDLYNPAAEMKADSRKLPLPDSWAEEIMAIQMFEHLSPYEVKDALREWRRVLKPNGLLVLEMPDILAICRNFEKATKQERYRLLNCIYGTTQIAHPHLFGWYDEILIDHLFECGYKDFQILPNKYPHWGYNLRIECRSTKER